MDKTIQHGQDNPTSTSTIVIKVCFSPEPTSDAGPRLSTIRYLITAPFRSSTHQTSPLRSGGGIHVEKFRYPRREVQVSTSRSSGIHVEKFRYPRRKVQASTSRSAIVVSPSDNIPSCQLVLHTAVITPEISADPSLYCSGNPRMLLQTQCCTEQSPMEVNGDRRPYQGS
ncbi:hypothetical protein K504DRAFT_501574 [Pleomassaria siparia CBS 279.74]|uniref:Uncharacterized protein n=1 Tax=Pleomassaria siparia CBS 279.74 TaxID=1314801 RepID=A0A6G1KBN3_9PLEO|nr:hypothetical protein K504DRAFT_501574 [Pleomassaria siparia CBS 279.74]